jgi:predicted RNA-binding Zn-ribbon protein involved in translation (DUF1610 family)
MGSILIAECKCGFEKNFSAGGGMLDFKTNCNAPAYCADCKKFIVENYLKTPAICPSCGKKLIFYNDPSLKAENDKSKSSRNIIFSWFADNEKGEFVLYGTKYLCPNCGKKTMRFSEGGFFD